MPLYEYYCHDCNGVFELLRPTREAAKAQPCPECDEDSERIMSRQWAAFVFRDGYPRRIPDDGKFWHLGHKVSSPITGASDGYTHPELKEPDDDPLPTVEDLERYEALKEAKRVAGLDSGMVVHDVSAEQQEQKIRRQLARGGGRRFKQERARILKKLAVEDQQANYFVAREQDAAARASVKQNKVDFDWTPSTTVSDRDMAEIDTMPPPP